MPGRLAIHDGVLKKSTAGGYLVQSLKFVLDGPPSLKVNASER
jgi:hypothetical protein